MKNPTSPPPLPQGDLDHLVSLCGPLLPDLAPTNMTVPSHDDLAHRFVPREPIRPDLAPPPMKSLLSLVNKLQRACTALTDQGEKSAHPVDWDAVPCNAVVGGQVRAPNYI